MEVLVPKLMAAVEKFDMVPVRTHKGATPISCPDSDSVLPDSTKPYFLKADKGPKYAAGGLLVKPIVRPAQADGKFAIARIEGGSATAHEAFSGQTFKFAESHHAFLIDEGSFEFQIQGETKAVATGETVFVPAGMAFSFKVTTRHGAAYAFTNGGGLVEVLVGSGEAYTQPVISEGFPSGLKQEWKVLEKELKFETQAVTNGSAA